MSSSSSRGSLGSLGSLCSSKSSLNSLHFADIYSQPTLPDIDLPDLHRRVERLLQGKNVGNYDGNLETQGPVGLTSSGSNQQLATIMELPSNSNDGMSALNSGNNFNDGDAASGVVMPTTGGYRHHPSYYSHMERHYQHAPPSYSNPNLYGSSPNIHTAHSGTGGQSMYNSSSQPDLHSMFPGSQHTDVYATTVPQQQHSVYSNIPADRVHNMTAEYASAAAGSGVSVNSSAGLITNENATQMALYSQQLAYQQQGQSSVGIPPPPPYYVREETTGENLPSDLPTLAASQLSSHHDMISNALVEDNATSQPLESSSSAVSSVVSPSGVLTSQSISAAVSNESVGGDSGVYEASVKR